MELRPRVTKLESHLRLLQNLSHTFASASIAEPLGTDQYGRSNLARLSHAIQTSTLMALFSVITSSVLGLILGVTAGWKASRFDQAMNLVLNVLLALPGLVLVLLIGALIPGSFLMLYIAISLILWLEVFRVIRGRTREIMSSSSVEASKLYGFGPKYIFFTHLWPELREDMFTLACFGASNTVLALASIGFVYVGLKPPETELGLMMVELFPYYNDAPWVLAQPLIALILLVLSCHFISGGSND